MARFRFTIGGILVLVLVLGISIAALRESTELWDCGVFGLTLLALLTGLLLAIHRTERARAFWLGFVLFGGLYLLSTAVPEIVNRLPTTKLLAYLDSMVPGRTVAFAVTFTANTTAATGGGPGAPVPLNTVGTISAATNNYTVAANGPATLRFWNVNTGTLLSGPQGTTENFLRIGHSLLAVILALVGAYLSRWLYTRERGRESVAREETDRHRPQHAEGEAAPVV